MIEFYTGASPNGIKVQIGLEELDLEYETMMIDLAAEEQKSETFTALNPNQKVPVIKDGEIVVWESGAIMYYLGKTYGKLLPKDPQARIQAISLLFFESAHVAPTIGGWGFFGQMMRPESKRIPAYIEQCTKEFERLSGVFERIFADGREYWAGEFSFADIQFYPGLSKSAEFGLYKPSTRLQAWLDKMATRPAVKKVLG